MKNSSGTYYVYKKNIHLFQFRPLTIPPPPIKSITLTLPRNFIPGKAYHYDQHRKNILEFLGQGTDPKKN